MIDKKCIKCEIVKPIIEFEFRKDTKKYRGSCRECQSVYQSKYNIKNIDRRRTKSREWYSNNMEVAKERSKKWKEDNPDRVIKNREKERARYTERYRTDEEFAERERERSRVWRKNNPSKALNIKKKQRNKLVNRISDNLRRRLKLAIKNNQKSGSAVRDLGCTIKELKDYLESFWAPGMSWENYGFSSWHIDHIVPLSSFDLTDGKEIKKACHYTNLQPLWAIDNLKKGSKIHKQEF